MNHTRELMRKYKSGETEDAGNKSEVKGILKGQKLAEN